MRPAPCRARARRGRWRRRDPRRPRRCGRCGRTCAAQSSGDPAIRPTPRVRAGRWPTSRPTFAQGRPSTATTSAVKSFCAAHERGADAVGVDRDARGLEARGSSRREAAGDDDPHVLVAGVVERRADLRDQPGLTPAAVGPPRARGRRATRRCRAGRPTGRRPSASATSSAVRTESFSKSTSTVTFISSREALGERPRRRDRVAAVGRDQPVRDGADPAAAPPGRLRVGRHADRPGDVRGPAVAGLHEPVVVAGGEEEDLLAVRGLDDVARRCASPACGGPGSRGRRSRGGRTARSRPRSS